LLENISDNLLSRSASSFKETKSNKNDVLEPLI